MSWRKDGRPIWASYQYNVRMTDCGCVLEVLNSDREEARGRYTCEISNTEGSDICHAYVKLGNINRVLVVLITSCMKPVIHEVTTLLT